MKTETLETYETPEIHELGKAEELTLGLPEGGQADNRGGYRFFIPIPPMTDETK